MCACVCFDNVSSTSSSSSLCAVDAETTLTRISPTFLAPCDCDAPGEGGTLNTSVTEVEDAEDADDAEEQVLLQLMLLLAVL